MVVNPGKLVCPQVWGEIMPRWKPVVAWQPAALCYALIFPFRIGRCLAKVMNVYPVALRHRTEYLFDRKCVLSPHLIRLRPAPTRVPHSRVFAEGRPAEHFLNWQQDPFGNFVARYVFPEKRARWWSTSPGLVLEMVTINPFDFFVEEYADNFPFEYPSSSTKELEALFRVHRIGPAPHGLAARRLARTDEDRGFPGGAQPAPAA